MKYEHPGMCTGPHCPLCKLHAIVAGNNTPINSPVVTINGPGTELTLLLQELGITKPPSCNCTQHAEQMDLWGVDGCKQNKFVIMEWMRDSYKTTDWLTFTKAIIKSSTKNYISLSDPLGSIVDEAIRRAEVSAIKLGVQIVVSADGIGDHILGLAIATKYKQDNPNNKLTFVAKDWLHPWIKLFSCYDELASGPIVGMPEIHNLSNRGGQHYIEAAANLSNLVPPVIKSLPQKSIDWAQQYSGYIVLCPGAGYRRSNSPEWAYNNRIWLPSHWLLLERLLIESGRRVVAIDNNEDRIKSFNEKLLNLPPDKIIALMQVSSCVVSNESGMAHVAGVANVPCITLSGPLDGKHIHRLWKKTKVIQGPLDCTGCRWTGPNYRKHCDTICSSLQSIQPNEILEEVNKVDIYTPKLENLLERVDSAIWNDRSRCFRKTLEEIKYIPNPLIVETGCQRQEDDIGAGMSTSIFGLYARIRGGKVLSIDNDINHVYTARKITKELDLPVYVSINDSVEYLTKWFKSIYKGKKIDLLYLDSLDTYCEGYAEHCLQEIKVALPLISLEGIILIDDTHFNSLHHFEPWIGKGKLAGPYLLQNGYTLLHIDHQALFKKVPIS